MILVRDIFQLRFGKAREALALMKEAGEIEDRLGMRNARVLTDLVGDFYTLVFETEYENLGQMEETLSNAFQDPEWRKWYERFQPLAESGRREIFRVVSAK